MIRGPRTGSLATRRAQRGAVLFIALIVLVAMSLAGLAMMRGVDTGAQIANNLAFKQGATAAADAGVEAARAWLLGTGGAGLYNTNQSAGYFSSMAHADFITAFDWSANAVALPVDAAGNQVSYVIHRLCYSPNEAPTASKCAQTNESAASAGASTKGAPGFGGTALTAATDAFYRITVRVIGPRNTVSYVQAVVF